MTSDVFRKLIQDQERLRKLTNPLGDLDKLANRDCCVSSHMSQFGQCGVLGHAVSNSSLMNWISPLTPDVLLWIWPRLIVRIVSIPLRVALADRSDRKL